MYSIDWLLPGLVLWYGLSLGFLVYSDGCCNIETFVTHKENYILFLIKFYNPLVFNRFFGLIRIFVVKRYPIGLYPWLPLILSLSTHKQSDYLQITSCSTPGEESSINWFLPKMTGKQIFTSKIINKMQKLAFFR